MVPSAHGSLRSTTRTKRRGRTCLQLGQIVNEGNPSQSRAHDFLRVCSNNTGPTDHRRRGRFHCMAHTNWTLPSSTLFRANSSIGVLDGWSEKMFGKMMPHFHHRCRKTRPSKLREEKQDLIPGEKPSTLAPCPANTIRRKVKHNRIKRQRE